MSFQAYDWVLQNSEARMGARLVALSLASHADKHGNNAFPSQETIAREAKVTDRHVRKCLDKLQELGEIVKGDKHPVFGTVIWRINMRQSIEVDPGIQDSTPGIQDSTPGIQDNSPRASTTPNVSHMPDKPSFKPSVQPSLEPSDDLSSKEGKTSPLTDTGLSQQASTGAATGGGFEAFWEAYPRQAKEPEARAAYKRVLATEGRDAIMLRLETWRRQWEIDETEEKYLPHPATFLEAEKYGTLPEIPFTQFERGQIQAFGAGLGTEECAARRTLAVYPYDPVTTRRDGRRATGDGTEKFDQAQIAALAEFKTWLEAEKPERFAKRKADREFPFDALTDSRRAIEAVAA